MTDQGYTTDEGLEEDRYEPWKDPDHDREPDEPDWAQMDWERQEATRGRERRRIRRRRAHDERVWRKRSRHRNDRFWLARNERWRNTLDDSAPF